MQSNCGRDLAEKVMQRLEQLGRITDEPGRLTRTFLSPAMRRAMDQTACWMRDLGMTVRQDNIGNVIGRLPAKSPDAPVLLLGSHLDTVPNAGKFDGALGVVLSLASVQKLAERGEPLPFHLDVIGFSEEEGVRYGVPYIGSRVIAGTFDEGQLLLRDSRGISVSDAIREFGRNPASLDGDRYSPSSLIAYCEVHIEQGPVLEANACPVGVVTAIVGQTRARIAFHGSAAHAGTVPMHMRRDALCGAAEFILFVESHAREQKDLVATVGTAEISPGVSNVIPERTVLTLDVRHPADSMRRRVCRDYHEKALAVARSRNLNASWQAISDNDSIACSAELVSLLSKSCERVSEPFMLLPSGAGHDAVSMAEITEVAMLFVRCRGGISHHPDEWASVDDIAAAISVMDEFIRLVAAREFRNNDGRAN